MFCIYSLQDNGNLGAGNLTPLGLFFVIFGIGCAFGYETGYAINLARDFGPRLVSYMIGYGHGVWSAGGYYFWVPMVAPFFGCLFGGWLYDVFIFTGKLLAIPLNHFSDLTIEIRRVSNQYTMDGAQAPYAPRSCTKAQCCLNISFEDVVVMRKAKRHVYGVRQGLRRFMHGINSTCRAQHCLRQGLRSARPYRIFYQ